MLHGFFRLCNETFYDSPPHPEEKTNNSNNDNSNSNSKVDDNTGNDTNWQNQQVLPA